MKQVMPTKQVNELAKLRREVTTLRSFMIGVAGRDSEGAYQPSFVRRILTAGAEEPIASYENPRQLMDFLAQKD